MHIVGAEGARFAGIEVVGLDGGHAVVRRSDPGLDQRASGHDHGATRVAMIVKLDLAARRPSDGPGLEQVGGGEQDPSALGDVAQLGDLGRRDGKSLGNGQ
jgi:hypothetical protein